MERPEGQVTNAMLQENAPLQQQEQPQPQPQQATKKRKTRGDTDRPESEVMNVTAQENAPLQQREQAANQRVCKSRQNRGEILCPHLHH